jgi:hypothetical protein
LSGVKASRRSTDEVMMPSGAEAPVCGWRDGTAEAVPLSGAVARMVYHLFRAVHFNIGGELVFRSLRPSDGCLTGALLARRTSHTADPSTALLAVRLREASLRMTLLLKEGRGTGSGCPVLAVDLGEASLSMTLRVWIGFWANEVELRSNAHLSDDEAVAKVGHPVCGGNAPDLTAPEAGA